MSARGGNGSHWEGCEEAHHDCALRFLEEARTALSAKQAELAERTRERDEARYCEADIRATLVMANKTAERRGAERDALRGQLAGELKEGR